MGKSGRWRTIPVNRQGEVELMRDFVLGGAWMKIGRGSAGEYGGVLCCGSLFNVAHTSTSNKPRDLKLCACLLATSLSIAWNPQRVKYIGKALAQGDYSLLETTTTLVKKDFDSVREVSTQAPHVKSGVDVSATTPQACRILDRGFFPSVGRRCLCQKVSHP